MRTLRAPVMDPRLRASARDSRWRVLVMSARCGHLLLASVVGSFREHLTLKADRVLASSLVQVFTGSNVR